MKRERKKTTLIVSGRLGLAGIFVAMLLCCNASAETNAEVMDQIDRISMSQNPLFAKAANPTSIQALLGTGPILSAAGDEGPVGDQTGTDPRDFSPKFMPYYLYTELDNNIKVNQLNLFGMLAFSPDLAMTYDWPVYRRMNYSSVLSGIPGGIGSGDPGSGPAAGTIPPYKDISTGGRTTGFGDLGLRFFVKNRKWTKPFGDRDDTYSFMVGVETTLPTASDDILGGDTTVVSPMLVFVTDIPGDPPLGLGFIALMNFYDFDVDKGSTGGDVERFRGRWFWMQPLSKPGPCLRDGLYILTEFQPIYDFRTDDFDLWMGPEFGKIISEGNIAYFKPGVGFDRDATDRKFTLEVGFRKFF